MPGRHLDEPIYGLNRSLFLFLAVWLSDLGFQLSASWPVEQRALGLLLAGGDFEQSPSEMGSNRRPALVHLCLTDKNLLSGAPACPLRYAGEAPCEELAPGLLSVAVCLLECPLPL